jgi:hypothetical protein
MKSKYITDRPNGMRLPAREDDTPEGIKTHNEIAAKLNQMDRWSGRVILGFIIAGALWILAAFLLIVSWIR